MRFFSALNGKPQDFVDYRPELRSLYFGVLSVYQTGCALASAVSLFQPA
jgi:hypothetical protein